MSEMDKLETYLKEHGYSVYRRRFGIISGEQIIVFQDNKKLFDAVCHEFSYGHKEGLLEIKGRKLVGDDVIGWQTADVIRRLEEYYA